MKKKDMTGMAAIFASSTLLVGAWIARYFRRGWEKIPCVSANSASLTLISYVPANGRPFPGTAQWLASMPFRGSHLVG
jgi:hypothetical protein